jgi:hypothetical protein
MDDRQLQTLLNIGSVILVLVLVGSFIAVIHAALSV